MIKRRNVYQQEQQGLHMTYDAFGNELKVGDIVTLDFIIESIKTNDSSPLPDKCNLRHINSDSYQWLREVNTSYCTKKSSKPDIKYGDSEQQYHNNSISNAYDEINKAFNKTSNAYPWVLPDDAYCPMCGEFVEDASHVCNDVND